MLTDITGSRDRLSIVQVPPTERSEPFVEAVRRGLTHQPKFLSCKFLYDSYGSELFERICEQPEYYATRTEDAILREHADEMVRGWSSAPVLIELGSGSSTKTRRLIEAALSAYDALHYVPIDFSPTILEESARALIENYQPLRVTGFAGDYHDVLHELKHRFPGPKLVVFLGSSLGNFDPADALALLQQIAKCLRPTDRFLLGTDLVKEPSILEAAYDDAEGVTAAFERNIITRINRELGSNIDPNCFGYQARFNPEFKRVEMRLISLVDQTVEIPRAKIAVEFVKGEPIHTENSHKYTPKLLADLAQRSGFVEEAFWTDDANLFRVQRWLLR